MFLRLPAPRYASHDWFRSRPRSPTTMKSGLHSLRPRIFRFQALSLTSRMVPHKTYRLTKEKEKKKAEEEQKLLLNPAPAASPDKDKKGKEIKRAAPGSTGIKFGEKAPVFYSKASPGDFPSIDEAATMKKPLPSPPKREEKRPEKPEKKEEYSMPSFTNTRKKDQGPSFAELKDLPKEHAHEGELVAQPSKEQAPRQFEVRSAGQVE